MRSIAPRQRGNSSISSASAPLYTFAAAICIKFDSAEKPTVHPSRASGVFPLYAGFFLYGIGMGGTSILAEMIWANYFGRISLGKIRGMGSLLTHAFSAGDRFFSVFSSTPPRAIFFPLASSSACCSPPPF